MHNSNIGHFEVFKQSKVSVKVSEFVSPRESAKDHQVAFKLPVEFRLVIPQNPAGARFKPVLPFSGEPALAVNDPVLLDAEPESALAVLEAFEPGAFVGRLASAKAELAFALAEAASPLPFVQRAAGVPVQLVVDEEDASEAGSVERQRPRSVAGLAFFPARQSVEVRLARGDQQPF